MRFQPSKCNMMQLSRKRKHHVNTTYYYLLLFLEGTALVTLSHIKYLGVYISSNLDWTKHISETCKKASRTLGLLNRNLAFCQPDIKEKAYKGLVRPVLEYASTVWDTFCENHIQTLGKVQKRAARFVTGNYEDYTPGSMTQILSHLKWELLRTRRKQARLILFKKGLDNAANIPTTDLKTPIRRTKNMHSKHFLQLYARTNSYKNSYLPKTSTDWNKLSQSTLETVNNDSFSKLIRSQNFF